MNLVNKNVGSAAWETLLAGNFPVKTRTITIKKPSKEILFGSAIGLATADKKGVLVSKAASDGTEKVYGILLHDVAVADADVPAVVAVTGEFVQDHIIFADGTKADDVRLQAEDRNIYFRKLVNVDKGEE